MLCGQQVPAAWSYRLSNYLLIAANPLLLFWLGTLSLTTGPFGSFISRSSQTRVHLLRKYEAVDRVSPVVQMVDVYSETNLSQYASFAIR